MYFIHNTFEFGYGRKKTGKRKVNGFFTDKGRYTKKRGVRFYFCHGNLLKKSSRAEGFQAFFAWFYIFDSHSYLKRGEELKENRANFVIRVILFLT